MSCGTGFQIRHRPCGAQPNCDVFEVDWRPCNDMPPCPATSDPLPGGESGMTQSEAVATDGGTGKLLPGTGIVQDWSCINFI